MEWERTFANPVATAADIGRVVHHFAILEFVLPSYSTEAALRRGLEEEVSLQKQLSRDRQ